ncbi:hypothetical protein [Niabella beijingensis]|uniref:hypothetical protein n=1 Tax=Niabella beijingensis TaxID=2872700 RepID=UPI001CBAD490|nr:hypothetical protein [Niabella beijingensis]MBZ4191401.1 hypothetical protein [Niabella beijingensis]
MLSVLLVGTGSVPAQVKVKPEYRPGPPVPDKEGFAGMFAGVSNNVVVAAGGANFPDGMPWEGGRKVWYDALFLFSKKTGHWEKSPVHLPRKLAYGVSVSYKQKAIFIGGSDAGTHYSEVYRVTVLNGSAHLDSMASMPVALANMAGAIAGDFLFVAGGTLTPEGRPVAVFLALDLKRNKWIQLPSWPGPERMNAVAAGVGNDFFLFSGIQLIDAAGGVQRKVLEDGYRFLPVFKNGELTGGDWSKIEKLPRGLAAGPGPAPVVKNRFVIFPGGLDNVTAQHKDPLTHPGFISEILLYDTKQDKWKTIGRLPKAEMRLTAPVIEYEKSFWIINGEIKPGKRTNTVLTVNFR